MKPLLPGKVALPQAGETGWLSLSEADESSCERLEAVVRSVGRRSISIAFESDAAWRPRGDVAATLTIPEMDGLRVFAGTISRPRDGEAVLTVRAVPLRLQRRRDFRLPLIQTIRVQFLDAGKQTVVFARLLDLSGGGAQIEADSMLRAGQRVAIGVPMDEDGVEEMVECIVLACAPSTASGSGAKARFVARVSFDDDEERVKLSEERRDKIVRYLFAQQRAALKLRRLLAPREESAPRPTGAAELLSRLRGRG